MSKGANMIKVRKRDGSIVDFDLNKIKNAIERAFKAENKYYDDNILNLLSLNTTAIFNSKIKEDTIDVEDIQDAVEDGTTTTVETTQSTQAR